MTDLDLLPMFFNLIPAVVVIRLMRVIRSR